MDSPVEHEPLVQLANAKHEFNTYLKENPRDTHYLSVSLREAPKRRKDGDRVIAQNWLQEVRRRFKWNDSKGRWTRKDGNMIVLEAEIYDVILSYFRGLKNRSSEGIWQRIHRDIDGIHRRDLREAYKLWKHYKFEALDVSDDTLWGGLPIAQVSERTPLSQSPDDYFSYYSAEERTPRRRRRDANFTPTEGSLRANRQRLPNNKEGICVGKSALDGTKVWLSVIRRRGMQDGQLHSVFYNHMGTVSGEEALKIIWDDEYKRSRFPGPADERKRAQREYVYQKLHRQTEQIPSNRGTESSSGQGFSDTSQLPGSGMVTSSNNRAKSKERPRVRRSLSNLSGEVSSDDEIKLRTSRKVKRVRVSYNLDDHSESDLEILSINPVLQDPVRISSGSNGVTDQTARPFAMFRDPSFVKSERHDAMNRIARPTRTLQDPLPIKSEDHGAIDQIAKPTTNPPIEGFSLPAFTKTTLLVEASNQPTRAPAQVYLEECPTLERLFDNLIAACNLTGRQAAALSEVSATYTWNNKRHLIRKAVPRDWTAFCEKLRKAWDKEFDKFADDECEVNMLVHVPP